MIMKECKKCNTEKNVEEFYKAIRNKDGLMGKCISCINQTSRDRYNGIVEKVKPVPFVIPTEKTCNKCDTTKPMSEYPNQPGNRDGKSGSCKICLALYNKNRDRHRALPAVFKCDYSIREGFIGSTINLPVKDIVLDKETLTNEDCVMLLQEGFSFLFELSTKKL